MDRIEEILKDFEKLGWFVVDGYIEFVLKKQNKESLLKYTLIALLLLIKKNTLIAQWI